MSKFQGLTSKKAGELLNQFGRNIIEEKKKNVLKKLIRWIFSPVSLMLLATAFLSLYLGKTADFWIIIFLFLSNFAISVWHERKADKSIEKLQQQLTLRVRAFRDGAWQIIDSILLVPDDIVELKIGAVVPADATIVEAKNLSINESVLTGESLPKQKEINDVAYSGSFVTTGNAIAKIKATGKNTYFGKTVMSIEKTTRRSSLEKDIISISKLISIVSIVVIVLLTIFLVALHSPWSEVAVLDLSLLIAGVPVALPTVMSLIISIGVFELSKKNVVVRRLASLEDLANVNMLLSDKTGTLTENKIHVERTVAFGNYSEKEILSMALNAAPDSENNPIDFAVTEKAKQIGAVSGKKVDFIPGDSERKRSTVIIESDGKKQIISLGASQIIETLCHFDVETKKKFDEEVLKSAKDGYRVLAISINHNGVEEKNMELAGILLLADRLREDASETIQFMNDNGIGVKMVTGDNIEISKKIASELKLGGQIYGREILDNKDEFEKIFPEASGFAEVLPKDKYTLVEFAREKYSVAVTGDGVNDLPAVKVADVGFAVSNAVDALKSSADIVLLSNGIAVIKNAIIEARKVFIRLYNYSIYRISESFRIIITIAVIGLIYKTYPLTPVQLIALALLNDAPIISLAFDKVKNSLKPGKINPKDRFVLSGLFGLVGVANSLILFFLMINVFHLSWSVIQTVFFLKLTVSGHMLVYVAHTRERWFKFLPSKQVIWATLLTQAIATALAFFGILTTPISFSLIIIVWVWSFFWMQISELMKILQNKIANHSLRQS